MKNTNYYKGFIHPVLVSVLFLFTNCTEPPIEKVTSLQIDLHDCESKGAKVFAQEEYNQVTMKMVELDNFMNQRKYKKADILADTIVIDINILKATLDTNGKETGNKGLAVIYEKLDTLKALLIPENYKRISTYERQNYDLKYGKYKARASELKKDLESSAFQRVYNGTKALESEITQSTEKFRQRMEQTGKITKK